MKKYIDYLLYDDETGRQFTKREVVLYGVVMPLVFILLLCVAGWLDNL